MQSDIVQLKTIEDNCDILHFKYTYDNDYWKCKFRTANIIYVDKNRTTKRKKFKPEKGTDQQNRKIYSSFAKRD